MTPLASSRQTGFTLIELMVVIMIVAILTTLALPSFTEVIVRNRLAAQNNDLIAALNLARTLAIQSRAQAGLCGANAGGTACAADFSNGYLVWVDENRDDAVGGGEVRRLGVVDAQDQLVGTADIRFNPRGQRLLPAAGVAQIQMQPQTCEAGRPYVRTVSVAVVGTVTQAKGDCS